MRLLALASVAQAARTVTWAVQTTASAHMTPTFDAWFADSGNLVEAAIVAANDAISEVKDMGAGNFEGRIERDLPSRETATRDGVFSDPLGAALDQD